MEIKFRAPSTRRAFRSCVCAMAWRFHAIDATLSPWPRRLDGVEVSRNNLTHCLISTQVASGTAPRSRASTAGLRHNWGAWTSAKHATKSLEEGG